MLIFWGFCFTYSFSTRICIILFFINTLPERGEKKKVNGTFFKMLFYLIIRAVIIITTLFLSIYVLGTVLNALHMLIHLILTNSMRYVPLPPHFEGRKTEAQRDCLTEVSQLGSLQGNI